MFPNKIDLAKEYQAMIDSRSAKNKAELARKFGVSRARMSELLNLLNNHNTNQERFFF